MTASRPTATVMLGTEPRNSGIDLRAEPDFFSLADATEPANKPGSEIENIALELE